MLTKGYQCPGCKGFYESHEAASDCCEVSPAWKCGDCGEVFEWEEKECGCSDEGAALADPSTDDAVIAI